MPLWATLGSTGASNSSLTGRGEMAACPKSSRLPGRGRVAACRCSSRQRLPSTGLLLLLLLRAPTALRAATLTGPVLLHALRAGRQPVTGGSASLPIIRQAPGWT